jgi:hypothetical protein
MYFQPEAESAICVQSFDVCLLAPRKLSSTHFSVSAKSNPTFS